VQPTRTHRRPDGRPTPRDGVARHRRRRQVDRRDATATRNAIAPTRRDAAGEIRRPRREDPARNALRSSAAARTAGTRGWPRQGAEYCQQKNAPSRSPPAWNQTAARVGQSGWNRWQAMSERGRTVGRRRERGHEAGCAPAEGRLVDRFEEGFRGCGRDRGGSPGRPAAVLRPDCVARYRRRASARSSLRRGHDASVALAQEPAIGRCGAHPSGNGRPDR
jgi:hypothetical protein